MKKIVLFSLLTVLGFLLPGRASAQNSLQLTIHVYELVNGERDPIIGATVVVKDNSGRIVCEGVTDNDGSITFTNAPSNGHYYVSYIGYNSYDDEINANGLNSIAFDVRLFP